MDENSKSNVNSEELTLDAYLEDMLKPESEENESNSVNTENENINQYSNTQQTDTSENIKENQDNTTHNNEPEDHQDTQANSSNTNEHQAELDNERTQNPGSTSIQDLNKIEAYDKIFAPFKAMGRQVTVKTPEEVVQLMQKCIGLEARYNQVKPLLKISKILKDNNLLDETELASLIDIKKGNKNAIAAFLKKEKIDPFDIDVENEAVKNYKPSSYDINPQQIEYDSTVENISSTEHGKQFLWKIANNLGTDQVSQNYIFQNPNILYALYDLEADGKLDQINQEFNRQQMISLTPIGYIPFVDDYLKKETDALKKKSEMNTATKMMSYNKAPIGTNVEKPMTEQRNPRNDLIPKMSTPRNAPTTQRIPLSQLTQEEIDARIDQLSPDELNKVYSEIMRNRTP